jgi:hypothetical protein
MKIEVKKIYERKIVRMKSESVETIEDLVEHA